MKKIIVILSLFNIACYNNVSYKEATHEGKPEHHDATAAKAATAALQLNNGA